MLLPTPAYHQSNQTMNRPGANSGQMRTAGFPPQASSVVRSQPNPPPGGLVARLQPANKLGSGSGWSFPPTQGLGQQPSAPSLQQLQQPHQQSQLQHSSQSSLQQQQQLQHQQQQQMQSSFAQTIGGMSQPATPLDLSEFPALGGGGTQQSQAQAWARTATQSPGAGQGRLLQEDPFGSHLNGTDDYGMQRGNPGGVLGQSSRQIRPGSLEDFPALPGSSAIGGEIGGERKGSLFSGLSGQNGSHMDHEQQRNLFLSGYQAQMNGQMPQSRQQQQGVGNDQERAIRGTMGPGLGVQNGGQGPRMSPIDPSGQRKQTMDEESKILGMQDQLGPDDSISNFDGEGNSGAPSNLLLALQQQQRQNGTTAHTNTTASSMSIHTPQDQHAQRYPGTPPSEPNRKNSPPMTELDKYGIRGMLPLIRGDSPDLAMLGLGTDLTQLGLELNQPMFGSIFLKQCRRDANAPLLHTTFASPWSEAKVRPTNPDYNIPACYTVRNTQPLDSKIKLFGEETLFYIFYTMPRDVVQEIVAAELYKRNWRYHKHLQVWLTKLPGSDPTQVVAGRYEKGMYVFFEPSIWEKVTKEILLEYSMLEQTVGERFEQPINGV